MAAIADRGRWTLSEVLTRAADVFVLGALWLIGSVPIVTVLTASTAVTAVTEQWQEGSSSSTWQSFWDHYRSTLGPAVRTQLVLMVPLVVAVVDLAYTALHGIASLGSALVLVVGMLLLVATLATGLSAAVQLSRTPQGGVDSAALMESGVLSTRRVLRGAVMTCIVLPLRSTVVALTALSALCLSLLLPLVTPFTVVGVIELHRRTVNAPTSSQVRQPR